MTEEIQQKEMSIWIILKIIVENIKLILLIPLLAGITALGISYLIKPTFTARTTILPPGSQIQSGAASLLGQLSFFGGSFPNLKGTSVDQYIAYLESNALKDQLIRKFNLMEKYKQKYFYATRASLKENVKVSSDKKSGLISIEVNDKDPKFAATLANAYVVALSEMIGELSLQEARNKRELLEKQIMEATPKSYQSPIVREAIINALIREYELVRLDEKKDRPFLSQIDVADIPEFPSKPKKRIIAIITTVFTEILVLAYIFLRYSWKEYTAYSKEGFFSILKKRKIN